MTEIRTDVSETPDGSTPPAAKGADSPSEPPSGGSSPIVQLLVIPSLIALICLAVMALFGLLASNATPTDPSECLETIAKGNERERWQAAYALVKLLADRDVSASDAIADANLSDQMVAVFRDLGRQTRRTADEEKARRYMAQALGQLGHASALPALVEGAAPWAGETLPDDVAAQVNTTRVYCTWALAGIGDPTMIPELIALTRDDSDDVRLVAVYGLGAMVSADDVVAIEALKAALVDPSTSVQWNAALALARHGNAAAIPTVAQLCDRTYLEGFTSMKPQQRSFTLQNGLRAARALATDQLRATVERIAADDPDLNVRQEARDALAKWGAPLDADETAPPAPGTQQG